MKPSEGQLFKLVAEFLDAHPAGQRRVDIHCFLRDEPPFLRTHMLKRAHVVKPVGELDEQHAHIARNRDQEFPEIFGLLCLLGDEIELFDLRQTIDKGRDIRAEQPFDLVFGGLRVLDCVVKKRCRNRIVVELQACQD